MVGKAGLLYTLGFAMILGILGRNMGRYAVETEGNMSAYCDATAAHNLALAGANVALAKFYHNRSWTGTVTQDIALGGLNGRMTATLANSGSSARLTSISTCDAWWAAGGKISDTVIVSFGVNDSSSFSQYAWFTAFNGNDQFWYGGDSVWGPVRSNGGLHMGAGAEVFDGKVTLAKNITGPGKATYLQGPPVKTVGVPMPADLSCISIPAGSGGKTFAGDINVTFNPGTATAGDGSVIIRNAGSGAVLDSFNTLAGGFNGAIWATGDVFMTGGTFDGRMTIGTASNIYIMGGGIRYEHNPRAGASQDVLGLCATNNIIIGKTSSASDAANWPACSIDAAMFALNGSFSANVPGGTGLLTVTGSICEGSKGDIMGANGKDGYTKRYHWDKRFVDPMARPPFFPGFGPKTYKITNWWESGRRAAYL